MNNYIYGLVALLVISLLFAYYYSNNHIDLSSITLTFEKLPKDFSGFRIVHLSDLHSKRFGKNQQELVNIIKAAKPDIITITGDIIDKRNYREAEAIELVNQACKIAPVYFVSGNHEMRSGKIDSLAKKFTELGCNVQRNSSMQIDKNGSSIYIIGVDDVSSYNKRTIKSTYNSNITKALTGVNTSAFKILLVHRPELFDIYASYDFDLSLSGHTHGGQVRIPFIGGIYVPNQGILPKYISGLYEKSDSRIYISRGLGSSLFPYRMFNDPEVTIITLQR